MEKWMGSTLIYSPVQCCLCCTEKSYKKVLKGLGIKKRIRPPFTSDNADATTHFFLNVDDGRNVAIVCVKGFSDDITYPQVLSLLVHEAVHVWQEIKNQIGEHSPSLEFEAYSIQGIAQFLISAYEDLG